MIEIGLFGILCFILGFLSAIGIYILFGDKINRWINENIKKLAKKKKKN